MPLTLSQVERKDRQKDRAQYTESATAILIYKSHKWRLQWLINREIGRTLVILIQNTFLDHQITKYSRMKFISITFLLLIVAVAFNSARMRKFSNCENQTISKRSLIFFIVEKF